MAISMRNHCNAWVWSLFISISRYPPCSFVSMKIISLPNVNIVCYSIFSFYSRIIKSSINKNDCSLGSDYYCIWYNNYYWSHFTDEGKKARTRFCSKIKTWVSTDLNLYVHSRFYVFSITISSNILKVLRPTIRAEAHHVQLFIQIKSWNSLDFDEGSL